MFGDRNPDFQTFIKDSKLNFTEAEYITQQAKNALAVEKKLLKSQSVLSCKDIQELHSLLCNKTGIDPGVINGNRYLPFFDENGQKNMVVGKRLHHELKILDAQTSKLMKLAANDKEGRLKAICFQALRLFSIHPFNDANKRMVKMMISHFIHNEFGIENKPKWQEIPKKVINQAVRGNNIGPFTRHICEVYGISYNPFKISELELSAYKIYPDTGVKIRSIKNELARSKLSDKDLISYKEPILSEKDLKSFGIKTRRMFTTTPLCKDLLSCHSTESLLRKARSYYKNGQLNQSQANRIIKQVILIEDGADEKYCKLATQKILEGEITDLKKAVKFYEKDFLTTQIKDIHSKAPTLSQGEVLDKTIKQGHKQTFKL